MQIEKGMRPRSKQLKAAQRLPPFILRKNALSPLGYIQKSISVYSRLYLRAGIEHFFSQVCIDFHLLKGVSFMLDPRYKKLAQTLVHHSCRVEPGDNVLVEAAEIPTSMLTVLAEEICQAGGVPIFNIQNQSIMRQLLLDPDPEKVKARCQAIGALELERMKHVQCYISMRGMTNAAALADTPPQNVEIYQKYWQKPVHLEQRVKHTRWVVMRWPNPAMAQLALMSTEAFEDYFFEVCLANYQAMEIAVQPLKERLLRTNKVRLTGPGTDLRFSIKDIGAVPDFGRRNIPDGECYSAPHKHSVEGTIAFNTPTNFRGVRMDNIRLTFHEGKVVEASSSDTENLNRILDIDEGARYIGEFSLGFNPFVDKPIGDTLFDEKIRGSLHLALGNCYDAANNGNKSSIHWDLVLCQEPGGDVYFDDQLIRHNGIFVDDELKGLNPDELKKSLA